MTKPMPAESEFVFRLHENAWAHLEWDGPSTAIAASLDEETRPAHILEGAEYVDQFEAAESLSVEVKPGNIYRDLHAPRGYKFLLRRGGEFILLANPGQRLPEEALSPSSPEDSTETCQVKGS